MSQLLWSRKRTTCLKYVCVMYGNFSKKMQIPQVWFHLFFSVVVSCTTPCGRGSIVEKAHLVSWPSVVRLNQGSFVCFAVFFIVCLCRVAAK